MTSRYPSENRSSVPSTFDRRVKRTDGRLATASLQRIDRPLGTAASLLMGTRAREGGGRQNRGKTGLTTQENECGKEEACTRKKPVPEGPAQTMALPQTVAAFRVQALERSRFAVGRLPAAYGDWSARPLACRSEGNGVRWVWKCLAELTTRLVSALRPSIAVARGDRATVRTRDFPSSPPMGDSFWLGL